MARRPLTRYYARYYRLDEETYEALCRIVAADGTIETETVRRLIREEAARRGFPNSQELTAVAASGHNVST